MMFALSATAWAQDQAESQVTTQPATTTAPSAAQLAELVLRIAGQNDLATRRAAAIEVLSMGDESGAEALLTIFNTQNNDLAKIAVCEAVARVEPKTAVFRTPLLKLLQHKDKRLREAAARALNVYRQDPEVDEQLEDFERQQLIAELIETNRELYTLLPDDAQRAERLLLWLGSQRPFLRAMAIEIVHQDLLSRASLPPESVVAKLRTMLADRDIFVRRKLVALMRDLRDASDAERLQARLEVEQSPEVRGLIYHALGYLGDLDSIAICVAGLEDPEPAVAAKAAAAIGELSAIAQAANGGEASDQIALAAEGLLALAKGGLDDDELRASVIGAMASIADPSFAPVLARHAGGEEPLAPIRQSAISGLGLIGSDDQMPLIVERLSAEKDAGVREAAVDALGRIGSELPDLQPLRECLDPKAEPSNAVRTKAWQAYHEILMRLTPKESAQLLLAHPEELVHLLSEAQLLPEERLAAAERLLDAAIQVGKESPEAALSFMNRLSKAVPPDHFGAAWATRFAEARQQLIAATRPSSQPSEA
jgi:HEAT repeat protein